MSFSNKYLEGLCYPTTRRDALRHALSRGADDRVIGTLRRLAERDYWNVADLSAELERSTQRIRRAA
jgi:hypothetical protein